MPAAVLWDMDGTLVDTEPYWMAAEFDLVEANGGVWTEEFAHELVGNALEVSAQIIIDRSGIDLSVAEVVDGLIGQVVARVRQEIPWRPGARELLAELTGLGVPSALVTMSWRSLADAVVTTLPEGSFAVLVTGDEVVHGKPHPEPYLTAARRLGVEPGDCVAIEDSPTGVRSATAAGVPTLAVPHIVPIPQIAGSMRIGSLVGVTAADLTALTGAAPAVP
ncbi:hydrolase [Intrasporangium oryzae NRRL B-24470]|uniref:Hydrolase n=1 Tax=Intrasporangium oryzae NRRL B-24470 TaxID=1386089 RepID=W9G6V8_9MICO|nr:hydrolase [Intrasporangium oryzae NRRL B-24470]